jgi:hypothetical protein
MRLTAGGEQWRRPNATAFNAALSPSGRRGDEELAEPRDPLFLLRLSVEPMRAPRDAVG